MTETQSLEMMAVEQPVSERLRDWMALLGRVTYPAALVAALSIWFLALRAPLWLDETLSYWQVSGGFGKVWARSALMPSSIGYLYALWAARSMLGSSEVALKIPSMVALFCAVYFHFRMARDLFDREIAFLACTFFVLEGNVVFAASDARPYAFAMLATTVAVLAFVRWMKRFEMRQAIWFGVAAAGIVYFHYLYASILPAFAIYYLMARWRSVRADVRQLAAVLVTFALISAPLIYRFASLYQTRQTHIVQEMAHPGLVTLNTLAPLKTLAGFVIFAFVAMLLRRLKAVRREEFPAIAFAPLLALVPAGILITVSTVTSAHLLIPRYLSVAAAGSALTWAILTSRIDSRWLRQAFCVALVGVTVFQMYRSPASRRHDLSFKPAHAFVNSIVTQDELPVLVCSAFIESNYELPHKDGKRENALLSQVDYYPIHAPVALLPMTMNDETVRAANKELTTAAQTRRRFLAIAAPDSYKTLEWLAGYSRGAFTPRVLGKFDDIVVVEFQPIGGVAE